MDYVCRECGNPIVVNFDGTTNHLVVESVGVDDIDYDADIDHTPCVDEDAVPAEPLEGDLVTSDHRHVYEHEGKLVLVVEEGEDFKEKVRGYRNSQGFYPNVWFVSDHGNAHLIKFEDKV